MVTREPSIVFILSAEPRVPVYHALNETRRSVVPDAPLHTMCKSVIRLDGFWTFRLPRRHAVKFARPCKQCFPENS